MKNFEENKLLAIKKCNGDIQVWLNNIYEKRYIHDILIFKDRIQIAVRKIRDILTCKNSEEVWKIYNEVNYGKTIHK